MLGVVGSDLHPWVPAKSVTSIITVSIVLHSFLKPVLKIIIKIACVWIWSQDSSLLQSSPFRIIQRLKWTYDFSLNEKF